MHFCLRNDSMKVVYVTVTLFLFVASGKEFLYTFYFFVLCRKTSFYLLFLISFKLFALTPYDNLPFRWVTKRGHFFVQNEKKNSPFHVAATLQQEKKVFSSLGKQNIFATDIAIANLKSDFHHLLRVSLECYENVTVCFVKLLNPP